MPRSPRAPPWPPRPFARAQDYPSQLIRWVVPYPAGGGTDVIARALAEAMRQTLGQQIVIDNRPGASTNIGADMVAKSKPDGYTVLSADNAVLAFNEHLFGKLPFNPEKDFSYIGAIGKFPLALVVHPDFPAKNFKEFLAYVKANPGKVNYASPGNGSPHHLAMEMFKVRTGTFITHIPYRGAAPAMADVMGGQVPCMFLDLASGLSIMKGNKVRVLAIGSGARSKLLPEVPTLAEVGVSNSEVFAFQGVLGPAGLPAPVVNKLNGDLNRAFGNPQVQKRFEDFAWKPCPGRRRSSRRCRAPSRSAGARSSSRQASSSTDRPRGRPSARVGLARAVLEHLVVAHQFAVLVPAALARDAAARVEARFGDQRALLVEALVRALRQLPRAARAHEVAAQRGALAVVVELGDQHRARIARAAVDRPGVRLAVEVVAVVADRLAGAVPALVAHQRAALGELLVAQADSPSATPPAARRSRGASRPRRELALGALVAVDLVELRGLAVVVEILRAHALAGQVGLARAQDAARVEQLDCEGAPPKPHSRASSAAGASIGALPQRSAESWPRSVNSAEARSPPCSG